MKAPALLAFSLSLAVYLPSFAQANSQPPTLTTDQGQIQGIATEQDIAFIGIPYAAPPVAEMRWKPSVSPEAWNDVLVADSYGALCPQVLNKDVLSMMPALTDSRTSEDCLTLNVHAPLSGDQIKVGKRPVIVNIHGGGFISGGSAMGDPGVWTREGLVYVSFNYRLGPLGFFAHDSIDASEGANFALTDMILALKWINRYIEQVGGDPDNVTIMGVSAGGQSTQLLMSTPRAAGLFHKVISQSGYGAWPIQPRSRTVEARSGQPSAEQIGDLVSRKAANNSTALSADELHKVSADDLVKAKVGFQLPIIDGITLPEEPGVVFAQAKQLKVPYIAGATSYEGTMYEYSGVTEEMMKSYLGARWPEIEALYKEEFSADRNYALGQIFGDLRYVFSSWWSTQRMSDIGAPAYLYMFDFLPGKYKDSMPGAPHGADAGFIYFDEGIEVADLIRQYWVNFIRNGNPNGPDLPVWSPATSPSPNWMILDENFQQSSSVRDMKMRMYEQLYIQRLKKFGLLEQ